MFKEAASVLRDKKHIILERWLQSQRTNYSLTHLEDQKLIGISRNLLFNLLDNLNQINYSGSVEVDFEETLDQLSSISTAMVKNGVDARGVGLFVIGLKETLLGILQEEELDPATLYNANLAMTRLMDSLFISTFETFIKGRERVILKQTDEINDLSTPVIKIWEGILTIPIIGTLDSTRAQTITESLLIQIVKTNSDVAIIDISGTTTMDSMVTQHLLQVVAAARLMGVNCIISGIRPEIAQVITHLGIDLSGLITKATLASALQYAFKITKRHVYKV